MKMLRISSPRVIFVVYVLVYHNVKLLSYNKRGIKPAICDCQIKDILSDSYNIYK